MLALKDSEPGDRCWLVTDRLSRQGNRSLMAWVEEQSKKLRFDRKTIDSFLSSDPGAWLSLFAWYAFADVPLGFDVGYALSREGNGPPQRCPMRLEHIIWERGVPLSATEHGHKHFLCWSTQSELPPLLQALPEHDDFSSVGRPGPGVYLVSASDLPHVQRRLSGVPDAAEPTSGRHARDGGGNMGRRPSAGGAHPH